MRIRSKDGADFRVRIEYGGSGDPDLVGMGERLRWVGGGRGGARLLRFGKTRRGAVRLRVLDLAGWGALA